MQAAADVRDNVLPAMEVQVTDCVGLPPGCLLSIRAGNTRRQAQVPLSEPLRFPNLPFNAKQFKVDVLQALGSARLNIEARGCPETYTVGFELADREGQAAGRASLNLTVREEPSLCGKRSHELKQVDMLLRSEGCLSSVEADARPGTALSMAADSDGGVPKALRETREYAAAYNIPNIVQDMLQSVLRERPQNPFSVMAAHMRRIAEQRAEEAVGELCRASEAEERRRLEVEHVALQEQRAALLRELLQLEAAGC